MKRREFSCSVYVEIVKRATINDMVRCEKCGCAVWRFHVHHLKEDALEIDKSAKLTAKDGQLLCLLCHGELTRPFQTTIAKVKRVEAKHLGVRKSPSIQSRGFDKSQREPHKTEKVVSRRPVYMDINKGHDDDRR